MAAAERSAVDRCRSRRRVVVVDGRCRHRDSLPTALDIALVSRPGTPYLASSHPNGIHHDALRPFPNAVARGRHRRHVRARPAPWSKHSLRAATPSPSLPVTARASARSPRAVRAATASSATSPRRTTRIAIALQVGGALGGLDVLVNNASSLGPLPLALLADTECEDFERALATNLLGPFRLTKALLGALAASAREGAAARGRRQHLQRRGGHAVCRLGRLRREQGGARHLRRIWDEELAPHGVASCRLDPGDMDTPLHALAVPDADPATLKRPERRGRELLDAIESRRAGAHVRGRA